MIDARSGCPGPPETLGWGKRHVALLSLPRGTHSFVTIWSDLGVDPLALHTVVISMWSLLGIDQLGQRQVLAGN